MVQLQNDIRFTKEVQISLQKELARASYSAVFVLVDDNTLAHCLPLVIEGLPEDYQVITIPAGEAHKTITTCQKIWQALTDGQADRHALMINLGGGVICDMGGFCARTYKRGIDFWNVPTTVLSQVDASVGGKLGVDFGSYKNHLGLFSEPNIVFIDPVFFKTLPNEEIVSGFAEMVKHTLISDVAGFEEICKEDLRVINWANWLPRSVQIKKAVVEADPTEQGRRKILNFGHTIGHAIESYFLETTRPLKHGEAIAVGMITECYLSSKMLDFTEEDYRKVARFLADTFPMPEIPAKAIETIAGLATHDKKNKDGVINAVLLSAIGAPEIDVPITKSAIEESLQAYNQAFAR